MRTDLRRRTAVSILALSGVVLTGCNSARNGGTGPVASTTGAVASTALRSSAGPAARSTRRPAKAPSLAEACKVLSLNLDLLTKVVATPNDAMVKRNIAQLRTLSRTGPADIRDAARVIADFDQKTIDALRSGQSADALTETPAVTAALSHEASWTAANCLYS